MQCGQARWREPPVEFVGQQLDVLLFDLALSGLGQALGQAFALAIDGDLTVLDKAYDVKARADRQGR